MRKTVCANAYVPALLGITTDFSPLNGHELLLSMDSYGGGTWHPSRGRPSCTCTSAQSGGAWLGV